MPRFVALLVLALIHTATPGAAGTPPSGVTAFHGAAASAGADAADGDRRGAAVALSGDILLVGAPHDNLSRGARAGSVLVYRRGPQGWALQTKLVPPQPRLWGGFGSALAIEGDTAVVGAGSQFGGMNAAFVYSHDGTDWRLQATLTPAAPPEATVFRYGAAVAISGSRVLVGAPGTTFGTSGHSGAAFLYAAIGDNWTQQAMFRMPQDAPDDTGSFSAAVALSGAGALIGAPARVGAARGEVFAFHDAGGVNWGAPARLLPTVALPQNAGFGTSMSLAGSLALISAPWTETQFVFRRVAGTWQQQSSIAAPGSVTAFAPPFAYFGSQNGVAAFSIDPDGTNSTALGPIAQPPRAYEFGWALAADGTRVAIGAPDADLGQGSPQRGAASVHVVAAGMFSLEQNLEQALGPSDLFGRAVAIDGNTALVGAPTAGIEDANGLVRWLERRGGRWVAAGELTVPGGGRMRGFGFSMALQGSRALIAAAGLDASGTGYNRESWLFRRDGAGWILDATLAVPANPGLDFFGAAVGLAGAHALVGAPRTYVSGLGGQGVVHAFAQTPAGRVRQQILTPPDDAPYQAFGTALALDESTLLVGAPSQSSLEPGAVHGWCSAGGGNSEEA